MGETATLPCPLALPPRATLVLGAEKTGKTGALARRAAQLVADGAAPADILAFAASPDGAAALRRRLAAADERLARVTVTVPRAWALDALADPRAREATGRRPRMLARFEESFLLEDMKVSGVRPGRIGSLLKFFQRGWTELADFDAQWLIFDEERSLHRLAKNILAVYGAYLEPEIANAAYGFLLSTPAARTSRQVAHVLVDDYQNLSRASQHLASLAARESLTVAANPATCTAVFDSYPYGAGISEFRAARADVTVEELTPGALPAGTQALLGHLNHLAHGKGAFEDGQPRSASPIPAATAPLEGIAWACCTTPAEECDRAVAWVADALRAGASPRDIAVVVPNKTWERNLIRGLQGQNIPTRNGSQTGPIAGDIRYDDLSEAAQFVALITLAACPDDAAALRAWCGFGDYLTCRALFSELIPACHGQASALAVLLAQIREDAAAGSLASAGSLTFLGDAEKVAARLSLLARSLDALRERRGRALVQAAADAVAGRPDAPVPSGAAGLLRDVAGNEDAEALAQLLQQEMTFPQLPDANAVAIIRPPRASGLEASHVALMGLVNGFAPPKAAFDRTRTSPETAEKIMAHSAEALKAPLALGERDTLLLAFETLRGTDAEAQGLQVDRFFVKNGVRMARVGPSVLLAGWSKPDPPSCQAARPPRTQEGPFGDRFVICMGVGERIDPRRGLLGIPCRGASRGRE